MLHPHKHVTMSPHTLDFEWHTGTGFNTAAKSEKAPPGSEEPLPAPAEKPMFVQNLRAMF